MTKRVNIDKDNTQIFISTPHGEISITYYTNTDILTISTHAANSSEVAAVTGERGSVIPVSGMNAFRESVGLVMHSLNGKKNE